jgi:hypothetical protein
MREAQGGSKVAKPQRSRPTVRVSQEPGNAAPGPRPVARKPVSPAPTPTPIRRPVRRPPVESTPTNGVEGRAAPAVVPAPTVPPAEPRESGRGVSAPPFGTRPVRAPVVTASDSTIHVPHAATSRAAAARTREASLRLFGDYSYVKRDLRRVAVLTVSALVVLIALSFLLPLWLK